MIDNIKELIENGKYQDLKKFLSDLEEADVAEILEGIKDKDTVKVWKVISSHHTHTANIVQTNLSFVSIYTKINVIQINAQNRSTYCIFL